MVLMSTEDELLRLVGLKALSDGFGSSLGPAKATAADHMVVGDRKGVELPLNGQRVKVGTVAYKNGTKGGYTAAVVDPAAFFQWVQANRPDAVVQMVAEWCTAEVLRNAERHGIAADSAGEAIPGIEVSVKEPGKPYLAVELVPTVEAKAALRDALLANNAAGVRSLLAIEAPGSEA